MLHPVGFRVRYVIMSDSVSRPSGSPVIGHSRFLREPGLAALLDQHVPADQQVLQAEDVLLHVSDFSRGRLKVHDGGLLQTDRALYFFPETLFGEGKKPLTLSLKDIDDIGLGEATLTVGFQRGGRPFHWEFEFPARPDAAPRCLAAIEEARRVVVPEQLNRRQPRRGDWLRSLRRVSSGSARSAG
jgi:hypothetical protein